MLLLAGAPPAALAAGPQAHVTRVGPAPAAQPLQLVLPLKSDLGGLRRFALAVSTPGSPAYGAYESVSQLARRFGASRSTRARVVSYLRRAGARAVSIDVTGLFADATMTAGLAERVFATPLAQFQTAGGVKFLAPARAIAAAGGAVRVPPALRGLVTGVVGLDTRPVSSGRRLPLRPARARAASQQSSARMLSGNPSGCPGGLGSGGFTPNQYLTAYGYDPLHNAGITGQGERVALIEIDGFDPADIQTFATCFGLPIPAINAFGVGVSRPLAPGGEATLDLEVLDAAAPGLKSIDVYEAQPGAADTLNALTAPLSTRQKPQVISASLGLCEQALLGSVREAGINAAEGALEMAAATGITFLASSGDQGSADCTNMDGTPARVLAVNYPASSWWVTGVGGTNLVLNAANQITSQVVWNDAAVQPGAAGGGGDSTIFTRPDYQHGFVRPNRRGVPDVSMLADVVPGYAIFCSAQGACINPGNSNPWQSVGGTSAATPLLAGGLALIDEQLRMGRKQDLGLVNPLLYSDARSPGVFYDVTGIGNDVGPDIGGNGRPLGCCRAHPGYDEASGLGSVKLSGLAGLALALEPKIVSLVLSVPGHQSPVRHHQIHATVSCSGPCLMGAYARVAIGRSRSFEVASQVFRLRSRGSRTIALKFSSRQLGRLRSALASGTRITATVHGALFDPAVYSVLADPGGSIQQQTGGVSIRISG